MKFDELDLHEQKLLLFGADDLIKGRLLQWELLKFNNKDKEK